MASGVCPHEAGSGKVPLVIMCGQKGARKKKHVKKARENAQRIPGGPKVYKLATAVVGGADLDEAMFSKFKQWKNLARSLCFAQRQ